MVILGGGLIGVATAAFLAEAGVAVTLIERDGLASGASGANSGVAQHPSDPVLVELYHRTVELHRALGEEAVGFGLPRELRISPIRVKSAPGGPRSA